MDIDELLQNGGNGHSAEQMRFSAAVCMICFPFHFFMFVIAFIHQIIK